MHPLLRTASLLILLSLLAWGCGQYQGGEFQPNALPQLSASTLDQYADTSIIMPRLSGLSSPSAQVDSLLHYAEWTKNTAENASLFYAQYAYDLATEHNWAEPRGMSANRLAWSKGKQARFGEDLEDAMVDARISKRLLADHPNPFWEADLHNLFGYLFNQMGQRDSAKYHFTTALQLAPRLANTPDLVQWNQAMILHNLGATCSLADSLEELSYYQRSDSLFASLENWENRSRLWLDWANYSFSIEGDFRKADSLLRFCIAYGEASNDIDILQKAAQTRGYLFKNRFAKSRDTLDFQTAVAALRRNLALPGGNAYYSYQVLGYLYQYSWAFDIDETHLDSAILHYKYALEGAHQEGGIGIMKDVSSDLSLLYPYNPAAFEDESIGQLLHRNYSGVVDTITNHAKSAYQRINAVEQRDLRISAATKRRNQLLISGFILLVLGGFAIIALQRQQNRRLRAEMSALRAQINPHFMSNSLNAIEHLVNQGENRAASKYLVKFSRLSRQILNSSADGIISLDKELATLKNFLALEQLRFSDKLTYDIKVHPDIDPIEVAFPAMLLQPYIENAIWHGIKPKEDGGHIQINVSREGKFLRCVVEDNGIGREAAQKRKEQSVLKQKSMGMDITQQRLRSLGRIKGKALMIEDLKHIDGSPSGTRIILTLPYKQLD
ncbi:MAG: histidine kinase [Bacteroidota bacterium]